MKLCIIKEIGTNKIVQHQLEVEREPGDYTFPSCDVIRGNLVLKYHYENSCVYNIEYCPVIFEHPDAAAEFIKENYKKLNTDKSNLIIKTIE